MCVAVRVAVRLYRVLVLVCRTMGTASRKSPRLWLLSPSHLKCTFRVRPKLCLAAAMSRQA